LVFGLHTRRSNRIREKQLLISVFMNYFGLSKEQTEKVLKGGFSKEQIYKVLYGGLSTEQIDKALNARGPIN
jgi:hypothetical protein